VVRTAMGTEWKSSKTVALLATTLLAVGGVTAYSLVAPKTLFSQPEPPPVVELPKIETVTAIGWLEPKGEAIQLSASEANQSSRVAQLLVNEGDWVKAGDAIAILESRDRLEAAVEQARAQVQVAEARLAQVKAGAKTGDISAASARFSRTQAELEGQIITQRAAISTLEAQLQGEQQAQEATLNRIAAELKDAQTNCQRYQPSTLMEPYPPKIAIPSACKPTPPNNDSKKRKLTSTASSPVAANKLTKRKPTSTAPSTP